MSGARDVFKDRVRGMSATTDQMAARLREEFDDGGESLVADVQSLLRSLLPLAKGRTMQVLLASAALGVHVAISDLLNGVIDEEEDRT